MKPSLFVVEDDPDISRLVRHHLENEGFTVRVYPTGANVLADAERQRPALFVLDIMVPGKDGLEICRTIRQTPGLSSVPVIFLTAKSSEADRVLGLELGADDYIAKPFSPRELVARVKAVLRRFERPLPPSPMKVGDIEIDPSAMTLTVRGKRFPPPPPSSACSIISPATRDASSAAIIFSTPSGATLPTSLRARSMSTFAASAKKSSPTPRIPRYLKTVRGAGYRFEVPNEK